MVRKTRIVMAALLPLALAACGAQDQTDANAAGIAENAADPALVSALQDQIMVDPQLAQRANGDAIRPPAQPYSGALPADGVAANGDALDAGPLMHVPPPTAKQGCDQCAARRQSITLGELAARQRNRRTSGCASSLQYSARWANRLPPDLPLYPRARVSEAAGTTSGACALRVVSFSSPDPMATMLDWYYTRAIRGGYDAEHQVDGKEHILGGTRERDDSAYVLFLRPRADGGTDVDLVANNGV